MLMLLSWRRRIRKSLMGKRDLKLDVETIRLLLGEKGRAALEEDGHVNLCLLLR